MPPLAAVPEPPGASPTLQRTAKGEDMTHSLITPDGLVRLTNELEHLMGARRVAIEERLQDAIGADANLLENSDYHEALADLAALERRIALLRERIHWAEVVEPDRSSDALEVGERVRVRDLRTGGTAEYELVGALEADPLVGRISIVSPLGRALLGRRAGDAVVVEAPRGRLRYEILSTSEPLDSAARGAPQSARGRGGAADASGPTRAAVAASHRAHSIDRRG
jgi:transcription elongation factor GreA